MFKVREKEQAYAFIPDSESPEHNQYGRPIDLIDKLDALAGQSLNINSDEAIGASANRYKQHGFYFNADNCISCHACESACSEKNDLPSHLAYRSVGYVEGGSYPNYTRLNISMACNHCDDPVCLKGCPTRAYTKFAEYGAVLQDPDICFGCGYCTWVCPYNAPQLDTTKGHVHKCNMCVDRLEAGLKPACVAACLGNALDFGVIETTPENRFQLETSIPGFPSPEITQPNIRFEQTRTLPREMTRTDSMPLRYEQDQQGRVGDKGYKTKLCASDCRKQWNLKKLRSREDPLVIFTLLTQAVIGAFILLFMSAEFALELSIPELGSSKYPVLFPVILVGLVLLETTALVLSTMHLGKPHRFYRAFNNLKYSPVSREVASIAVFYNFLVAYTFFVVAKSYLDFIPDNGVQIMLGATGWGAAITGPVAIYFMHKIYRIKARPFWNHWQVLSSFYGSVLSLGSLVVLLAYGFVAMFNNESLLSITNYVALPLTAGLLIEAYGVYRQRRDLMKTEGEGAASIHQQSTTFGRTHDLRNSLLMFSLASIAVLQGIQLDTVISNIVWLLIALSVIAQSFTSRALFYVLVIPTTMPGAFFWRNKSFQEHARETGLAQMDQVGVLDDQH